MGRRKAKRKSQSVAKTNAYFSRFQVKFARRRDGTSSSTSRLGLSRSRDDHRVATDASMPYERRRSRRYTWMIRVLRLGRAPASALAGRRRGARRCSRGRALEGFSASRERARKRARDAWASLPG